MKKLGVVITTISNGDFLFKFEAPVIEAGTELEVVFYIVGDVNTPVTCSEKCLEMNSRGIPCHYLSVEEQAQFVDSISFPASHIPYKSDNRRNVGFLKAFEEGCDMLLSMDDDNFPVEGNFFLQHMCVGTTVIAIPVSSRNRWVNPMHLLLSKARSNQELQVYPRGFPFGKRWLDSWEEPAGAVFTGVSGVNTGLWSGDPDVDAITRLTTQCLCEPHPVWDRSRVYALANRQLMPINSQNTAITREAVFAYYFIKMGYRINHMVMDRFGDIFSGYFLLLCNQAVGNIVTFGNPLVFQDRNEHNLLKDLSVELPGILIIEELVPFLEELLPKTASYGQAYSQLIENLRCFVHAETKSRLWTRENLSFIDNITTIMEDWVEACHILNGTVC